jgi:hypothetical protein
MVTHASTPACTKECESSSHLSSSLLTSVCRPNAHLQPCPRFLNGDPENQVSRLLKCSKALAR